MAGGLGYGTWVCLAFSSGFNCASFRSTRLGSLCIGGVHAFAEVLKCAIAGALAVACGIDEPVSTGEEARILYVGDSIAANTYDTVKALTEGTHKAIVHQLIFPGMALCDFLDGKPEGDPPFPMKLSSAIEETAPQLVIVQFWGNRFTPCITDTESDDEYLERYFSDGLLAVEQIESSAHSAGLPRPEILWVLQGPEPGPGDRIQRLNEGYARIAEIHGDRTSDAGWTVSEAARPNQVLPNARHGWTQFLPCTDHEKANGLCTHFDATDGLARLHRDDDPVHFCLGAEYLQFCATPSPGAVRYGSRIAGDAIRSLDLAEPRPD